MLYFNAVKTVGFLRTFENFDSGYFLPVMSNIYCFYVVSTIGNEILQYKNILKFDVG